jgi:hypothetical protein
MGDIEFAHGLFAVPIHRGGADAQAASDLLGLQVGGDETKALAFTWRKELGGTHAVIRKTDNRSALITIGARPPSRQTPGRALIQSPHPPKPPIQASSACWSSWAAKRVPASDSRVRCIGDRLPCRVAAMHITRTD